MKKGPPPSYRKPGADRLEIFWREAEPVVRQEVVAGVPQPDVLGEEVAVLVLVDRDVPQVAAHLVVAELTPQQRLEEGGGVEPREGGRLVHVLGKDMSLSGVRDVGCYV